MLDHESSLTACVAVWIALNVFDVVWIHYYCSSIAWNHIHARKRNLWVGIEMIRCCRKGGRLRRKNSKNLPKGQQKICHEGHIEHAFERVMVDLVVWSVSLLENSAC